MRFGKSTAAVPSDGGIFGRVRATEPIALKPESLLAAQPPTRAERAALRVLQAGAILVVLVAVTYREFELDRFFIPKELVLHATASLAGLLALGSIRRTVMTRVDFLLVGYLLVSAVSAALAQNPWLAARALAVNVSGVALFWTARCLRNAGLIRPLVVTLAAGVVVAAVTALLQAYGLRVDLFSINRAPGGTLGNRNFIGHLIAFGLPLLLLAVLRARRVSGFLLGGGGILLVLGTLVLTRSRAAWLGVAVVLVVLLGGVLLVPPLRRAWQVLRRFLFVLVFAGVGVVAAVSLPNTLAWRSETPYLETARGVVNYREGSGRGRLIQYWTTVKMTVSHPLLGVGPGNWPVHYLAFADGNDPSRDPNEAGMTANPWPSSDWVAFLGERGLVGLLLLGLAWLGIAAAAWRAMRAAQEADQGLTALVVLATLCGVTVVGAFDAVTLLAWPTFFFWTAAGVLWPHEAARTMDVGAGSRILMLLVLVLLAGAAAVRSTGQVAAMHLYAANGSRASLERAALLDPGNYRVHLRLAQRYRRDREQRCEHAQAAHALFPLAAEAGRLARRCE